MNKKDNIYKIIIIIAMIFIILVLFLLTFKSNKNNDYKINLEGDKYITLYQDEEYIEPGFIAYKNNELVTNKVEVINEIKNIPGIYRILYKIDNYYEYRYVEIKEKLDSHLDINLEANITNKTNKNIKIDISVTGDMFSSLTLPDGKIVYNNLYTYEIEENGIYKFVAKNTNDEEFVKEINIDYIDKDAPVGTCEAILTNVDTTIKVNSESNLTYQYYDDNSLLDTKEESVYKINKKTSKNIKVIITDEASNETKITCNIIDQRYYEPITPYPSDNIVYHGDTSTFKTYIVNRNTYFMTYIWVKDAYTQLNKMDSDEYGSKLVSPKNLLIMAKDKYNLRDKIIIGFNASALYLKGTFDSASVNAYSKYDKTSVGTLVITNGKVIRNAYQYAVKTWYTIGVNKDNQMLVFEDKKTDNVSEKLAWSQSVIDSGIRNTFTFAAPLIQDGKQTNITTSMPGGMNDKKGLQIICQINDNNFLLFTSRNETRKTAVDEFLKLGCKTAMNLDGGGSIALYYKDKNSDEIKRVIGGNRNLPEVGYFTE